MLHLESLRASRLLSSIDLVTLTWLYKFRQDPQEDPVLLSLLTLFFYHQGQSQIGLPTQGPALAHWYHSLCQSEKAKDLEFCALEDLPADPVQVYASIIGLAHSPKPLIWSEGRLYTQKLFSSEAALIQALPARLSLPPAPAPAHYAQLLGQILQGGRPPHARQAAAIALAPLAPFFVLSGGPGTGKTTVLAQILRTWLRLDPRRHPSDILLCAPTGKAKARMLESLSKELSSLQNSSQAIHERDQLLMDQLPKSQTLHQVLWKAINAPLGAQVPRLSAQLIVVDEVSMVDLGLFQLLLQSLAPQAQLLLLGDMNQLPSVDHGAVLGDLTEPFALSAATLNAPTSVLVQNWLRDLPMDEPKQLQLLQAKEPSLLCDKVIQLSKSYRSQTHILQLAQQILHYGPQSHWEWPQHKDLHLLPLNSEQEFDKLLVQWLDRELQSSISELQKLDLKQDLDSLLSSPILYQAFGLQSQSRILCMQKSGPGGVNQANEIGKNWLQNQNRSRGTWLHGEPVMMTVNHHALDLYNGDCGMILRLPGQTLALFWQNNTFRAYATDELQGLNSAFALTIHKSQGSEYEHPLILIPFGGSNLATKEIFYTGVTRAKSALSLGGQCSASTLGSLAAHRIERPSRLRDFLRSAPASSGTSSLRDSVP